MKAKKTFRGLRFRSSRTKRARRLNGFVFADAHKCRHSHRTFQANPLAMNRFQLIHEELFALTINSGDGVGSIWEVFAWMGEFHSSMSPEGGYRITF